MKTQALLAIFTAAIFVAACQTTGEVQHDDEPLEQASEESTEAVVVDAVLLCDDENDPDCDDGEFEDVDAYWYTAVHRFFTSRGAELHGCHTEALRHESSPSSGRLVLSFVIEPDGSVTHAAIDDNTLNSPLTEECLVDRIQRWNFPPPPDGEAAQMDFPLIFRHPSDDSPRDAETSF